MVGWEGCSVLVLWVDGQQVHGLEVGRYTVYTDLMPTLAPLDLSVNSNIAGRMIWTRVDEFLDKDEKKKRRKKELVSKERKEGRKIERTDNK